MKKQAFSLIALALILVGCQKGTLTGQVLDVFTKKPIANAKVQVINTPFAVTVGEDGKFEFPELDLGKLSIKAGKNKFSQSQIDFELTEKAPSKDLTVYLFNRKGFAPGLYFAGATGEEKILNSWVGMDAMCSGDIVAFKQTDVIEKTKAKVKIEPAFLADSNFEGYFFQKGGNEAPIEVLISPISVRNAEKYKDQCKSIGKNDKLIVADLSQSKKIETEYVSHQMVKIVANLTSERQLVSFLQQGKVLANYILKGK